MRLLLVSVAVSFLFFSCSINNLTEDQQLKKYFDQYQVSGTFAMFDNAQGHFTIYDTATYRKRFTPASTFKIVNSLIGLETGRITDENMIIPWDGVTRSFPDWNKDLTMTQAFEYSCVPYYQEVARRIGRDTMQFWLDTLAYGNKNCSGPIDSFWLNQNLRISPDEQLGLVKKLYFEQLPFQKRTQQIVRKVMLRETTDLYKLSYKTGWSLQENLAWIVGWIEENRRPYFFVLLVKATQNDQDLPTIRKKLLTDILSHYDFMKGKK